MGYIVIGSHEYQFEDRLLAHLKVVIGRKLSTHESFFMSWSRPVAEGGGLHDVWISPSSNLGFHFNGGRAPELNQVWLEVLMQASHSNRGLIVISEKDALQYAKAHQ